jgi:hypothetical protein
MKKHLLVVAFLSMLLMACNSTEKSLNVVVSNPLNLERVGEMVEIPMETVQSQLNVSDASSIIMLDENGSEIPFQLTYNQKIIFPATVGAGSSTTYVLKKGIPSEVPIRVCGKVYPVRMDDLAWENDLVGFRAYGPALQALGERGFGYDLFVKRGTDQPVLEKMYAMETDKETWTRINELKKTDPVAAEELRKTITYHVDRGYGMDCYAVGPTLGGGVAALMDEDEIIYPWCYKQLDILDNGPLRFTAKLEFTPLNVRGKDNVIETRIISLDLGSHLNRTSVSYTQLEDTMAIVTGIVMHNVDGAVVTEAKEGYMTYVDPTTGPNQGTIFMGAAFPNEVKEARTQFFSAEEKKSRNNADGHVLAISDYVPGNDYVYYWGFAWDRADIQTIEEWNDYMAGFAQKVRHPLTVVIK